MYRSQYFEGGRVLQAAISAIDIALHDIKGKALGVPVYELLGGKQRDRIPTFASTGDEAEGDVAIERARELRAQGWQAIRFFPVGHKQQGHLRAARVDRRDRAAWLQQGARGAGRRRRPRHRLSPSAVGGRGGELLPARSAAGTLDFLEEPIRDETPEAYESLRTMTDMPFAIGEEFASKWQFLPYIERGIHQFNRLDVCNVGGLTEAMKVAGWSEAHYVDLMPHNPLGPVCTAATVHFAAAVPNFAWLETRAPGEQSWASTIPSSSRCNHGSTAPTIRSATSRGSASRSTRRRSRRRASGSGKRLTSSAATALLPTGSSHFNRSP